MISCIKDEPEDTQLDIYLRNKGTQQPLRVIVNIQYDASFSANDTYP